MRVRIVLVKDIIHEGTPSWTNLSKKDTSFCISELSKIGYVPTENLEILSLEDSCKKDRDEGMSLLVGIEAGKLVIYEGYVIKDGKSVDLPIISSDTSIVTTLPFYINQYKEFLKQHTSDNLKLFYAIPENCDIYVRCFNTITQDVSDSIVKVFEEHLANNLKIIPNVSVYTDNEDEYPNDKLIFCGSFIYNEFIPLNVICPTPKREYVVFEFHQGSNNIPDCCISGLSIYFLFMCIKKLFDPSNMSEVITDV